jgi:hypothetical protein
METETKKIVGHNSFMVALDDSKNSEDVTFDVRFNYLGIQVNAFFDEARRPFGSSSRNGNSNNFHAGPLTRTFRYHTFFLY